MPNAALTPSSTIETLVLLDVIDVDKDESREAPPGRDEWVEHGPSIGPRLPGLGKAEAVGSETV